MKTTRTPLNSEIEVPDFTIIQGDVVSRIIFENIDLVVQIVREAYRAHGEGACVNPHSVFLRFPNSPRNRIIALPAYVGGEHNTAGIKWIASFPGNIEHQIPRASAVIILNDIRTGYPYCCLEGSVISAARTAASAVVAAESLRGPDSDWQEETIGFIGNGVICKYIADFVIARNGTPRGILLNDINLERSEQMMAHLACRTESNVRVVSTPEELIRQCSIVVFATSAVQPHIFDRDLLVHNPLVLHISLRDLDPTIVLGCNNVVDDVDMCLTAQTSPHLAEQLSGNRSFVSGTLYDVMLARCNLDRNKPTIFSPFGMGILDLLLAEHVFDIAVADNLQITVPAFFEQPSAPSHASVSNGDSQIANNSITPRR